MSAPVFKAAGAAVSGTGAISVAWPAGHAAGDIGLLCVNSSAQTVSTPSGWTLLRWTSVGSAATANSAGLYVFYRVAASGAEANVSVADSGDHTLGAIITFTGASVAKLAVMASQTFDQAGYSNRVTGTGTTTITLPEVTTAADDCLIVAVASTGQESTKSGWSYPNVALTERLDGVTTSGLDGGIAAATGTLAAAGTTGTGSATQSISTSFAAATLVLWPEAFAQTISPASIASAEAMGTPRFNGGAISITPAGDAIGFTNRAFSRQYAALGGTNSYTWSVSSGGAALAAAGISLSAAGLLSWTTATAGVYPITIRATDGVGAYGELALEVEVKELQAFARLAYVGNGTNVVSFADTGVDMSAGGVVILRPLTPYENQSDAFTACAISPNGTSYLDYSGTEYYNTSNVQFSALDMSVPGALTVTLPSGANTGNRGGQEYELWLLPKIAGVLDVVAYTGNGSSPRTLTHNLGVVPAFVMSGLYGFNFYQSGDPGRNYDYQSVAAQTGANINFPHNGLSSSAFAVGGIFNENTRPYAAVLIADTSTTAASPYEVASYTGTASATPLPVTLGWTPELLLIVKDVLGSGARHSVYKDTAPPGFAGREVRAGWNEGAMHSGFSNVRLDDAIQATATGFEVTTAANEVNDSTDLRHVFAIRMPAEQPAWKSHPRLLSASSGTPSTFSSVDDCGEVFILAVRTASGAAASISGAGAADWSYLHHVDSGASADDGVRLTLFYSKPDNQQPSAISVNGTGATCLLFRLDNVDVAMLAQVAAGISAGAYAGYYNSASSSTATTSIPLPGLTTADENTQLITVVMTGSTGNTVQSSTWNHADQVMWHGSASFQGRSFSQGRRAAPGATGGGTATFPDATSYASVTMALRQAPESSPQTVTLNGIPSAEAFGAPKVNRTMPVTGIASTESLGTPTLLRGPVVRQVGGIAGAEAVGSPTALPGALTRAVDGIATEEGFGEPLVQQSGGTVTVIAVGIPSAQALGAPTLLRGAVALAPVGLPGAEAFGAVTVAVGATTRSVDAIAPAEAFGALTVQPGETSRALDGIPTSEAFGAPTVSQGAITLQPAGIASGEAFGTPAVGLALSVQGIASAEAVGAPTVLRGAVTRAVTSIASVEAFGTPAALPGAAQVQLASIASAEQVGAPQVQRGPVVVALAGIPGAEAFGAPSVAADSAVTVAGIASAEAFGSPSVALAVAPAGIASSEAVGAPTLAAVVRARPAAIPSGEALGAPTFTSGTTVAVEGLPSVSAMGAPHFDAGYRVAVDSIPGVEQVGLVALLPGEVYLGIAGIGSGEAIGVIYVGGGARMPPPRKAERPREVRFAARPGGTLIAARDGTEPVAERPRTEPTATRP